LQPRRDRLAVVFVERGEWLAWMDPRERVGWRVDARW
jgi:hypothetical protein